MAGRGSSHQGQTWCVPHQLTGGMLSLQGKGGVWCGVEGPTFKGASSGILVSANSWKGRMLQKPPQRPTMVDGPLLSMMLLLAHCSVFCGKQRETQGTEQTVSPSYIIIIATGTG